MNQQHVWTREDLPGTLLHAIDLAVSLRARVPVVLRVTEISGYTDWVLLLSGRSERNVRAIADAIHDGLSRKGSKAIGHDGLDSGVWSLLDYDDFVVHVFYHPVRSFYDLESMWSDAPSVELGLSEEVMNAEELNQLEAPSVMPPFRGDLGLFGGYADEFDNDIESSNEDQDNRSLPSSEHDDEDSKHSNHSSDPIRSRMMSSLDDLIESSRHRFEADESNLSEYDDDQPKSDSLDPRSDPPKDEDEELFDP